MRKIYLVLCAVFCYSIANAQKFSLSAIPLAQSNFEIKKGFARHPYDAKIYTDQSYKYGIRIEDNKNLLLIDAVFVINREKSWIKEEFWKTASQEKRKELIDHEKGHLIISLIQFKKLQQMYTQYAFSKQRVKFEVDSIWKSVINTADSINKIYDEESNHMLLKEKQIEWITKLMHQFNEVYADDNKIGFKFKVEVAITDK